MRHFGFFDHKLCRESVLGLGVILTWLAGLLLGFTVVRFYGDTLVSCISQAIGQSASFAVILVTLLPLLISAFAAMILHPYVFYVICLLRGAALAMMLQALCIYFSEGAYLVAVLLLFSSLLFSPVLLWYWWRRLCMGMVRFSLDTFVCIVAGIAIGVIDHCLVSPFLVDIINF